MFIETHEYDRFREFCDACRKYRYIGLCYGRPGVGKTLSARHYANWDKVEAYNKNNGEGVVGLSEVFGSNVVFYTASVVNSPNQLRNEMGVTTGSSLPSLPEPPIESVIFLLDIVGPERIPLPVEVGRP